MRNTTVWGMLCLVISIIGLGVHAINSIMFNKNCSGYIKQAADANTVELAMERLDVAIKYAESEHLTDGYTSVFYKTESDNIGFWYQNLLACRQELESCIESSQLEKTNVLLKVRESLTDDSDDGVKITLPKGISRYPNNLAYGILLLFSLALLGWAFILFGSSSYYW